MQHLQLVGWNLSDALGWHPVQGLAWEQHAPRCHQAAGQMEEDAGVAQPRGAQNRLALLSVCIVCQISVPVAGTALSRAWEIVGGWPRADYQDC